jgi:undecaprenyl diphosphate synthase
MQPATANNQPAPRHIAVIMDGNGRWAQQHGLPRHAGHRAGVRATRAAVENCAERGVEVLTLFAFSSENWRRPQAEVTGLMSLFLEVLQKEVSTLDENDVRLRIVGNSEELPLKLQAGLREAEQKTVGNQRMVLLLAVAYGGRWDVVQAAKRLVAEAIDGNLPADKIDENIFAEHMSLAGLPSPDLLIRTGGERRISNFLLWDLAYTELYFTDVLWPDFESSDLDAALAFYADRERRFGKTGYQVSESTK